MVGKKKQDKILLHTCCAPCTTYVFKKLSEEGFKTTGFFYNPNIHPYTEYEKRLMTMKLYSLATNFDVKYLDIYDIENYFRIIYGKGDKRCLYCYMLRLHKVATYAKKNGYSTFTTTLLVSPYQKHDWVKQAGRLVSKKIDIPFFYEDFRKGYKESRELAREMNLYRQQYCGCIFSERDRFWKAG